MNTRQVDTQAEEGRRAGGSDAAADMTVMKKEPSEEASRDDADCGCSLKGRSNKLRFVIMLVAFAVMVILIVRGFAGAG
jgi:hypothetical protein